MGPLDQPPGLQPSQVTPDAGSRGFQTLDQLFEGNRALLQQQFQNSLSAMFLACGHGFICLASGRIHENQAARHPGSIIAYYEYKSSQIVITINYNDHFLLTSRDEEA